MTKDCSRFREALSARLDGEDPGMPDEVLERHLRRCPSCAAFEHRTLGINRGLRVRPAEPVPDLTPRILSTLGEASAAVRRRAVTPVRLALAATGLAQLFFAAPQLLGATDALDAPSHIAHELGSFGVALAIGFLAVAWRPAKASGLTALTAVVAAGIAVTAGADIVRGTTSITHEVEHLPEILGFVLVWILAGTPPQADPGRAEMAKAA